MVKLGPGFGVVNELKHGQVLVLADAADVLLCLGLSIEHLA